MRIFNPDSPLMEALSMVADLVILNLVVLACCIPVVTAGAALTGMHYVLLKMVRNEDGYIVRTYFKSFRQNFVQATAMWLLFLLFGLLFFLDLRLTGNLILPNMGNVSGAAKAAADAAAGAGSAAPVRLPGGFRIFLMATAVCVWFIFLYAFPLFARFSNTVFGTLRNAAVLAAAVFPRTLGMTVASLVIPVAALLFPPVLPVVILAGLTAPGLVCAHLYSPVFAKMEGKAPGAEEEEGQDQEGKDQEVTAE